MIEVQLSGIKKIEEIANSSSEYISLSQGAVKIGGIPQAIKEHVKQMLNTDKTDYYGSCWGLRSLREKLATVLSTQYNTNLTPDNIIPSHGSIGGLSLLHLAILSPGDEVIIPDPAYPAYATLTEVTRAKPVFVSMLENKSDGTTIFNFDVERIKKATTPKTKIVIFSNPSNPMGTIAPGSAIKELLTWCEQRGIYLIVDEAYREYVFSGQFQTVLPWINQSEHLICANTFSKNMAMSGWRVGYLVIPKKISLAMAGMQDALLNCLNNTAQHAALFALDHPEYSDQFRAIVKRNRDLTMQMLQPLVENKTFSFPHPDAGLYVFLKTEHADATDLCMSILNKAKVSMVPGKSFGPAGLPYMRLCFSREEAVLKEGLNRILRFFM